MHHTSEARSGSNSGEARTYSKLVGYVRRSPTSKNAVVELNADTIRRTDFHHEFNGGKYAKLRIDREKLLAVLNGTRAVAPVLLLVTDQPEGAQ